VTAAPESPRAQLEAIFRVALAAVDGAESVRRAVTGAGGSLAVAGRPVPAGARVWLFAAGKAAAPMAAAFEARAGSRLAGGLAVAPPGHGCALARTRWIEASHPVPDAASERAGREAIAWLERAEPGDVVCVLLSGGASALLACPGEGVSVRDLAEVTRLLLRAGADIEELNTVRKHLSALAGGRLVGRCRAGRIEVLAISDVPGDRPEVIGSGPFAADPTSHADALAVLARRGVLERVPPAARAHLEAGARGAVPDTVKPGDPALARVSTTLVATNRDAVTAAREAGRRRGLETRVVAEPLAGEAREAGRRLVDLALRARSAAPILLVAGGETTVTVRGAGRGGRNQELALAAAIALAGRPGISLLAAGTDGTDGSTPAAGAFADAGTVERGRRRAADARAALADNDSHGFFAAEGGLFTTGPTGTNVMDLALVRVDPPVEDARPGSGSNASVSNASKSV
jgi:glycerate-2-kinase